MIVVFEPSFQVLWVRFFTQFLLLDPAKQRNLSTAHGACNKAADGIVFCETLACSCQNTLKNGFKLEKRQQGMRAVHSVDERSATFLVVDIHS